MAWPKGLKRGPRKPKEEVVVETKAVEATETEIETPKKERKPRATKASKSKEDDNIPLVDEETLEARRKLDDNTLDPFKTITNEKFECNFVQLTQWAKMIPEDETEVKDGRYSSSHFPIKGCNANVWPVLAYIQTDLDKYREAGYDDKTIYAGCINYLSAIPAGRKKKYGNLMPFTFSVKDNKIIATFITDDRKNKNFWSEGVIR
jgi:hypothetical protein